MSSVLETVQKAPYGTNEEAGDAIKVLEGASITELSYALANTSITPTTIARVVAFNSQLSSRLPLSEQLELLSHIRSFASQVSWAEAELYSDGMDRLLRNVAAMDETLTVLKAHILHDFARSYGSHYGESSVSLAHTLLVSRTGEQMPALTKAILSECRLSMAKTVFVPTKNELWHYFYEGSRFCSKEKQYHSALFHAVVALALAPTSANLRRTAPLVTVLNLIVHGEPWPFKSGFEDSDARIYLKYLLPWFESTAIENTLAGDEQVLTQVVEPLENVDLGYLAPQVVVSRRLHRLRVLHRTIRRTDWTQLSRTGTESIDELIAAGYKGQIYMRENMTIIESPDYEIQLGELYDLLEQVIEVAERL